MNKPEKLILDYSKWRCGGDENPNQLGHGDTLLLNKEGYFCCIGLWSIQLGATENEIYECGDPSDSPNKIQLFINPQTGFNNQFANDCIDINDRTLTTPEEKIEALSDRLSEEGIQLEVINKP